MIDVKYCYMKDVYEKEISNIKEAKFTNDIDFRKRKVNDLEYRDPDSCSKKLVSDITELYFSKEILKSNNEIIYLKNKLALSTDYLGPSATTAKRIGITDDFVWNAILECRTIGGHIVWPRMTDGINSNKAKSGFKGNGISDRADIAFYEIKNYLENNLDKKTYNIDLKKCLNNEENKRFFEMFNKSFKDFCDYFDLVDSFVNKNYDIILFADPELKALTKNEVINYFNNNINAIKKRNEKINQKLIED